MHEPGSMELALETLRNNDFGLYAA
jgi:hypothetical protein